MRQTAACIRSDFGISTGKAALIIAAVVLSVSAAAAQAVPETLRINVEPPEPAIRAITINKKYRPIISRDDKGVVVDSVGSDNKTPPCDVKLEVTLENSRVLHRDANICSGGTLVVDVSNDGKPGATARIVGAASGVAAGPVGGASETATSSQSTLPTLPRETPADKNAVLAEQTPASGSDVLKPLDQVDTPISTPGAEGTDVANAPAQDFETIINDTLARQTEESAAGGDIVIQASDQRQWSADPGNLTNTQAHLDHSVPQTDDRDFQAFCNVQSGFANVIFQQAPGGLAEGMPQAIRITAGDFSAGYNAFGSSANNQYGQSLPEISLPMTDPLWEALIKQNELAIAVEGMPVYAVSLKGSANPVRLFIAACAEAQQIVAEDTTGFAGEEANSDLSCNELGRVRSVEAVRPGQIVFRNASRQPIDVQWVDYRGGERPYARLEPGQILEQQTYISHAWTIRDASGQCRGIYVTKTPYREVVINGPAAISHNTSGGINDPFATPGNNPFPNQSGQFPAGPIPPGNVGGGQSQYARANVADYLCTAGIDLNVVFSPDGSTATVSEMGYGTVNLQRQGGANTFYYENQGHVLKGQIQNATWARPGLRDVFCARR